MGVFKALMIVPKKVRKFCLQHTRGGKVDLLEELTTSLTCNTKQVKEKYGELKIVEQEVECTLDKLKSEDFHVEFEEIDSLTKINDAEKKTFKNALIEIKDAGIRDLEPIAQTAQQIKAHMLITLNKAQVQKAILIAKSKLAGNANMQLDTLRLIEKQTRNINFELDDLLKELNKLNENAIGSLTSLRDNANPEALRSNDIIAHIAEKLEPVMSIK